jgi:peptidoglycan/LPS O-acetylase OafA/YrhL
MAPRLAYQPWLDGMRAFAVVAVLLFHEQLLLPTAGLHGEVAKDGLFGVDVFFVISGFLITTLLLQEPGSRLRHFYERRARRLLPALGLLLCVLLIAALTVEHGDHRNATLWHILLTFFYSANWAQAVFNANLHELSHAWSLACEEQYYLLWPAVILGLRALRVSARWMLGIIAAAAAFACAYPVIGERLHWSFPRVYYALDTHSCGLLVGSALGVAYASGLLPVGWTWLRRGLALIGAITVVVLVQNERLVTHLPILRPGDWLAATYALVSLATALVIWELVVSPPHIGHRLLGAVPLRAVGRISYALYLFGPPVIFGLTPAFLGVRPSLGVVALQLAVTFALATASWFVVERRILYAGVPS